MADNKDSILQILWNRIREIIKGKILEEPSPTDVVSKNARSVLIGLFVLLGFAIILYAVTISSDHFTDHYRQKAKDLNTNLLDSSSSISTTLESVHERVKALGEVQKNLTQDIQNKNATELGKILTDLKELGEHQNNLNTTLTQADSQTKENLRNIEETNELRAEEQRIDRQLDQINAVFIAAIAGTLALGGTLVTQLWGRRD